MKEQFNVYFAGDIFDHKHLVGNALLASFVDRLSLGAYRCTLPQDFEQGYNRRVSIRNQDLRLVIESDIGLFNFDGTDLDSGTVVEYIVAKQLDIPSVLLRSDIRYAGDQSVDGDNWNLMCSNYPRTEIVLVNGMELYKNAAGSDLNERIESIYTTLANRVIDALNTVRAQEPISSAKDCIDDLYRWTLRYCGGGLEEVLNDSSWIQGVIDKKREKGLIK